MISAGGIIVPKDARETMESWRNTDCRWRSVRFAAGICTAACVCFAGRKKTVGAECAALLETDTLLELTGCGETGALLEELGFSNETL